MAKGDSLQGSITPLVSTPLMGWDDGLEHYQDSVKANLVGGDGGSDMEVKMYDAKEKVQTPIPLWIFSQHPSHDFSSDLLVLDQCGRSIKPWDGKVVAACIERSRKEIESLYLVIIRGCFMNLGCLVESFKVEGKTIFGGGCGKVLSSEACSKKEGRGYKIGMGEDIRVDQIL